MRRGRENALAEPREAGAPRSQTQGVRSEGEEEHRRTPGEVIPKRLGPPDVTCLRTVSHQYFWYHHTLNASNNIEEGFEVLVLNLSLGIFAVWLLLFLILVTGLKMSMQVSHPPH